MSIAASERYVTTDFNQAPLVALANLMGLGRYQSQIASSPEVFTPILNGIAVYRHIDNPQRHEIMKAIRDDVPRSHLTDSLRAW